jgi:CheY-like chemotaxis protein
LATYRKAMVTMTKKLLLVDDDPSSISALLAFFITEKFQVRTANDGVAALDVFGIWLPDVAILDINMPYRDGYEVARRIRSSQTAEKRTLLVALSGETPRTRYQQSATWPGSIVISQSLRTCKPYCISFPTPHRRGERSCAHEPISLVCVRFRGDSRYRELLRPTGCKRLVQLR